MSKKSTILFVDGSNLYAGQYALFGPKCYLSFSKFINELEKSIKIHFDTISVYASYSPIPKKASQKEKAYLKNEALFYKNIRKTPNTLFFKGYRSKTSGKEKEVDVKLAVDLVDFAHKNQYSSAYLFSGDADFLQVLLVAKKLNKDINVLCLKNKLMYKAKFYFKTYIFSFTKQQDNYFFHQKTINNNSTVIEKTWKTKSIILCE